jgi:ABC-2 type transport system ATP-binding protein
VGVARSYGSLEALAPTDVAVHAGEILALVGPNGAGKSTLLSILAGALPPTAGTVATDLGPSGVGWAPQRPAQYGHLTAVENLELFARLAGLADARSAAGELAAQLQLPATRQRASQLSVGNQQRLNIAIALLGDPLVLLLDEPTASLDPLSRRRLWQLLTELRSSGGGAVVATHVLDEAELLADRVLVLLDGRVVHEGTPAEAVRAMERFSGAGDGAA